MTDELTDVGALAAALVRIPTPNPPGEEAPAAQFVREWFTDQDIQAELVEEPDPARPQVIAAIGTGSPRVVLNGHLDVVPATPADWSVGPYDGVVRDGRLYGRGSVDMKTGLALAMVVARDLAARIESGELPGSLVVQAAIGEETGDPGTLSLLERGPTGDVGIVLEPTAFRVATQTRGLAVYRLEITGERAHAAHPDRGPNAISRTRDVLEAIDRYDEVLRHRGETLCGRAQATVTSVEAGANQNHAVSPGSASLVLDRRITPEESLASVQGELDSVLASATDGTVELEQLEYYAPSSVPTDTTVAEILRTHTADVIGDAESVTQPWGMQAATDMRNFVNDADVPAVTWGPGDLAAAHSVDESIELADVHAAKEVLELTLRELLAGE